MHQKAVPSRIGFIAELCGVMHDLHVGRSFLYPPALPANAAIWDKCSDKEVTSSHTQSVFWGAFWDKNVPFWRNCGRHLAKKHVGLRCVFVID